jgi:hypothetical protein
MECGRHKQIVAGIISKQTFIVILRYSDMGVTKSVLFKKRQNRIATLAKAFDHPARVAILEYLLTNRTCIQMIL